MEHVERFVARALRGLLAMLLLFALRPAAAAPPAPAAPAPSSPGASVLLALQHAESALLVREALVRDSASASVARVEPRDTTRVDASWLLRFERYCDGRPAEVCRERPLIAGQSYELLFAVTVPGAAVTADFRHGCLRFAREGEVVETRSLKGAEAPLVVLLRAARPRDAFVGQLARASGVEPVDPSAPPAPPVARPAEPDTIPDLDARIEVDEPAVPIERAYADYPDDARDAGIQGTVLLFALVGTDGSVKRTVVTKGVPALDAAAQAAVQKWRFQPAKRAGRPVMVWVPVPVSFRIH